jgi:hypothetical protein
LFKVTSETEMAGRCTRYAVHRDKEPLPYSEVLDLWQRDEPFRSFFLSILTGSSYEAFRWETPPVTRETLDRPFEFVLVDSPEIARTADPSPFREHFRVDGPDIVSFENLGGDAKMVVPCPRGPDAFYGHLAGFVRSAPSSQLHALWQTVGAAVRERVGDRPLWLSTAGGGVFWLHVRLDSRPKYYAYPPYRATR